MFKYLLGLAALSSSVSAAATSGDFNVLTFNVAGLPAIFNDNSVPGDKATNAGTIGSLFAKYDYDVIHVQEDFAYHAYIYAKDTHPFRTATSGTAPFGSGLNSLSNFNWIEFLREKWATCSNASGADCLTPKGFTFMRMLVSEGVYIDFYNLHEDAGTEDDDLKARAANTQQVANYIDTWSAGNAVVVFGDTNSRYSRPRDLVTVYMTQNGMKDAFVELEHGNVIPPGSLCVNPSLDNTCETVDKVFYRGSKALNLQATYFNYESTKFLQSDGKSILSDHNPITVNFTWSASNSFRQSPLFGGNFGTWYNDLNSIPASVKASTITFRGGSRLDSVALTLSNGQTFTHGGTGGTQTQLTLAADEYWVSSKVCQGTKSGNLRLFSIQATTSSGRTLSGGSTTGDCATYSAPDGWQIVGYQGRSGDEVDLLAFIYAPR